MSECNFKTNWHSKLVSLNRLSVGCGTTPIGQSGLINGFCLVSAWSMQCRHLTDSAVIYLFYKQLQICISINFYFVLILNSFYNTALFDKKVSLFNLYAILVGLDNAATSRMLVKPAANLILQTNVNLNFYLLLCKHKFNVE